MSYWTWGSHGNFTKFVTSWLEVWVAWGSPKLVAGEVRVVWLETMPLICDVCTDSGWFASELNCSTSSEKSRDDMVSTLCRKQTKETQVQIQGDWLRGYCSKWWWIRLRWLLCRCWGMILFTTTVDPNKFARGLNLKNFNGCIVATVYGLGMSCLIYLICCW